MYLNSTSGTNGYYYPGMFDSGNRVRNKHVGGFSDDEASSGNTNTANQNSVGNSANTTNLTQNAPQATGAAQSVGQSGSQAGQASQTGNSTLSPDFQSEENILSSLVDTSLEALNIVPSSEIAGTQINFSGLSYDISSSQSAAAGVQGNQVGAALDESQSATLEGEGEITTPDGTTYAFQIALQVGDDQQAAASAPLQGSANGLAGLLPNLGGNSQGASSAPATQAGTSTSGSDGIDSSSGSSLSNYLAQLVNEMTQSASQAYGSDPNSFLQSPGAASSSGAAQNASTTSSASSSGSTATQPTINWDAIQKQTSSLIDMLDAMISANQSAGSGTAASTATTVAQAGSAASNTATATAAA